MPSISRQYHPHSCSLEITAQTSPLSRWAGRPILKSVNFLLSFRGLSGRNHEPLEIRGNHEQLQQLSETVTHYVQNRLGQSLVANPATSSTTITAFPEETAEPSEDASAKQLYLRPRSLVTHDLVLGPLSTNAKHPTISLKATQLFDLVSALDDCAAELAVLPLSKPSQRPAIPVWASSAAIIVLMLGVSTATLQLTQQNPASKRDWVTSSDQNDANAPTTPTAEGTAAAPKGNAKSQPPPITSQPSIAPSPRATPSPRAGRSDLEHSSEQQPPSSIVATAPRQDTRAPSVPSQPQPPDKPQAPAKNQQLQNQPQTPPQEKEILADQSTSKRLRQPVAVAPPPADSQSLRPQASSPSPAAAPLSKPAAEAAPETTADTSAESSLQEADRLHSHQGPHRSLHQFGRKAPGNTDAAYVAPQSAHVQNLRQYLSQRWQVPAGLPQPLQYQLTLNANGSLKQVQPLDKVATQYLEQIPLPALNQPFIAPLQPSQTSHIRLVLKPDGTVQVFEGMAADKAQ